MESVRFLPTLSGLCPIFTSGLDHMGKKYIIGSFRHTRTGHEEQIFKNIFRQRGARPASGAFALDDYGHGHHSRTDHFSPCRAQQSARQDIYDTEPSGPGRGPHMGPGGGRAHGFVHPPGQFGRPAIPAGGNSQAARHCFYGCGQQCGRNAGLQRAGAHPPKKPEQ